MSVDLDTACTSPTQKTQVKEQAVIPEWMMPKNLSLIQEVDEDKTMSIIPQQRRMDQAKDADPMKEFYR